VNFELRRRYGAASSGSDPNQAGSLGSSPLQRETNLVVSHITFAESCYKPRIDGFLNRRTTIAITLSLPRKALEQVPHRSRAYAATTKASTPSP
jgi:hypothetical protein